MDDLETWLERVYEADGDHKALQSAYDEWANDYDQQLWASGNHDARVLATMVADPAQMKSQTLDAWAKDLDSHVVTDAFSGILVWSQVLEWQHGDGLDGAKIHQPIFIGVVAGGAAPTVKQYREG